MFFCLSAVIIIGCMSNECVRWFSNQVGCITVGVLNTIAIIVGETFKNKKVFFHISGINCRIFSYIAEPDFLCFYYFSK